MEGLTGELNNLALAERNCIPLVPAESSHSTGLAIELTPRYLYRVFDHSSPGETNANWVRSRDALLNKPTSVIDVFRTTEHDQMAHLIWGHLRWRNFPDDNLVSWTSSLLFAIQYIFYRHHRQSPRPSFSSIKICVLDTRGLPSGALIRDLDLIKSFVQFSKDLKSLERERTSGWYFGEYLSQGSLKVEERCQIVSAQALIDLGLLTLRPEFKQAATGPKCGWAKDVVRMSTALEHDSANPQPSQDLELLRTALRIGELFPDRFRAHVMAHFTAIIPGQIYAGDIVHVLKGSTLDHSEHAYAGPMMTYTGLSDLSRAREIIEMIHAEHVRREVEASVQTAQHHIEHANNSAWTLTEFTTEQIQLQEMQVCRQKVNDMLDSLRTLQDLLDDILQSS